MTTCAAKLQRRDPISRYSLRQALKMLAERDLRALADHPLAERLAAHAPPGAVERGAAFAEMLTTALESLLPDSNDQRHPSRPADKQWRAYQILTRQYLHSKAPLAVARELFIEESTYQREQGEALDLLGSRLLAMQPKGGQPTDAVPIFTAPPRPQNKLVGRDASLNTIKAKLLASEDVALHGLPGVGKSALTVALAHDPEVLAHFSDGVLWASLGAEADIFDHLGRWCLALGMPQVEVANLATPGRRAEAAHRAIGVRRMLLIVDDAWDAHAALTFRLGGPCCAHLMTSRIPSVALDFPATNVWQVKELDSAASAELLAQRAPGFFRRFPQDGQALAESSGGLPLALTLMGNFLRRASASNSGRRMQDAVRALGEVGLARGGSTSPLSPQRGATSDGAKAEADARALQAALHSTLALSVDVLSDAEQEALYALSVFPPKPNTFSEAAALAVMNQPPAAFDALCDAGLIEVIGERYGLHKVIADYGRLKSSDPSAHERLAQFFVQWIDADERNYAAVELEQANVLAALQVAHERGIGSLSMRGANAIFEFLETRGRYADAERLLLRAEAVSDVLNDRLGKAKLLLNLGRLAIKQADFAQARRRFEHGLQFAREAGDDKLTARALQNLGGALADVGDYEGARDCYEEGLGLARALGDKSLISVLLMHLSAWLEPRGDYAQAEALTCEGLALAQEIGQRDLVALYVMQLGILQSKRGAFAEGGANLMAALTLAREIGHQEMICTLLFLMSLGAMQFEQYDQAQQYLAEGLRLARQIRYERLMILLIVATGNLESLRGNFIGAEAYYAEALARAQAIQHIYDLGFTSNCIGVHSCLKRDWDAAIVHLSRSIEISEKHGLRELNGYSKFYLARALAETGDLTRARLTAQDSLAIFEAIGYWRQHEVHEWLANLAAAN